MTLKPALLLTALFLYCSALFSQTTKHFVHDNTSASIPISGYTLYSFPNSTNLAYIARNYTTGNSSLVTLDENGAVVRSSQFSDYFTWPTSNHSQTQYDVISLDNGNLFIVYYAGSTDTKTYDNARYIVIAPDGTLVSSGVVNSTDPGNQLTRFFSLTKLSNGKIVALFQRTDNSTYAFRIISAEGTPEGSDIVLSGANVRTGRVAAGTNGNFMVVYFLSGGALRGQLYNASGTNIPVDGNTHFTIHNSGPDFYPLNPVGLLDGTYAIFYGTTYGTYWRRFYNADGTANGTAVSQPSDYNISSVFLNHTAGQEGYYVPISTKRYPSDPSDLDYSVSFLRFNNSGVQQEQIDDGRWFNSPSTLVAPGKVSGFSYLISYYKSVYVEDYGDGWIEYYPDGDNDVVGVFQNFSNSGTLPVTMRSFTAYLRNGTAQLEWETSAETQNSHFSIEKSTDARNFTRIGTVNGAGNSNLVNRYSFSDPIGTAPIVHYRLLQHDLDGKLTVAGTRVLRNNGVSDVRLSPNPVPGNSITIENTTPGASYQIYGLNGQMVSGGVLLKVVNTISVSALPAGMYHVRLGDGQTVRFIRQ
ncbi:T9SS type A sorting domain-containing protein [Parasegetibacter sp. NRK P23]|uniref:T9SS type A sorting domain-containing protein n=1 Tax=Parasegetibacter sp. NRK P23 TaxID=2942999 RepID=UPI0020446781|nr:T9SS type A sorting domain-containing protein [Parasegetibacter sp. NRK P23]MCM5528392.1 T9SS type A sorting domain-containing protein [Parasegetibacter sp. NRK P23]